VAASTSTPINRPFVLEIKVDVGIDGHCDSRGRLNHVSRLQAEICRVDFRVE
jgi:hypothetical protein